MAVDKKVPGILSFAKHATKVYDDVNDQVDKLEVEFDNLLGVKVLNRISDTIVNPIASAILDYKAKKKAEEVEANAQQQNQAAENKKKPNNLLVNENEGDRVAIAAPAQQNLVPSLYELFAEAPQNNNIIDDNQSPLPLFFQNLLASNLNDDQKENINVFYKNLMYLKAGLELVQDPSLVLERRELALKIGKMEAIKQSFREELGAIKEMPGQLVRVQRLISHMKRFKLDLQPLLIDNKKLDEQVNHLFNPNYNPKVDLAEVEVSDYHRDMIHHGRATAAQLLAFRKLSMIQLNEVNQFLIQQRKNLEEVFVELDKLEAEGNPFNYEQQSVRQQLIAVKGQIESHFKRAQEIIGIELVYRRTYDEDNYKSFMDNQLERTSHRKALTELEENAAQTGYHYLQPSATTDLQDFIKRELKEADEKENSSLYKLLGQAKKKKAEIEKSRTELGILRATLDTAQKVAAENKALPTQVKLGGILMFKDLRAIFLNAFTAVAKDKKHSIPNASAEADIKDARDGLINFLKIPSRHQNPKDFDRLVTHYFSKENPADAIKLIDNLINHINKRGNLLSRAIRTIKNKVYGLFSIQSDAHHVRCTLVNIRKDLEKLQSNSEKLNGSQPLSLHITPEITKYMKKFNNEQKAAKRPGLVRHCLYSLDQLEQDPLSPLHKLLHRVDSKGNPIFAEAFFRLFSLAYLPKNKLNQTEALKFLKKAMADPALLEDLVANKFLKGLDKLQPNHNWSNAEKASFRYLVRQLAATLRVGINHEVSNQIVAERRLGSLATIKQTGQLEGESYLIDLLVEHNPTQYAARISAEIDYVMHALKSAKADGSEKLRLNALINGLLIVKSLVEGTRRAPLAFEEQKFINHIIPAYRLPSGETPTVYLVQIFTKYHLTKLEDTNKQELEAGNFDNCDLPDGIKKVQDFHGMLLAHPMANEVFAEDPTAKFEGMAERTIKDLREYLFDESSQAVPATKDHFHSSITERYRVISNFYLDTYVHQPVHALVKALIGLGFPLPADKHLYDVVGVLLDAGDKVAAIKELSSFRAYIANKMPLTLNEQDRKQLIDDFFNEGSQKFLIYVDTLPKELIQLHKWYKALIAQFKNVQGIIIEVGKNKAGLERGVLIREIGTDEQAATYLQSRLFHLVNNEAKELNVDDLDYQFLDHPRTKSMRCQTEIDRSIGKFVQLHNATESDSGDIIELSPVFAHFYSYNNNPQQSSEIISSARANANEAFIAKYAPTHLAQYQYKRVMALLAELTRVHNEAKAIYEYEISILSVEKKAIKLVELERLQAALYDEFENYVANAHELLISATYRPLLAKELTDRVDNQQRGWEDDAKSVELKLEDGNSVSVDSAFGHYRTFTLPDQGVPAPFNYLGSAVELLVNVYADEQTQLTNTIEKLSALLELSFIYDQNSDKTVSELLLANYHHADLYKLAELRTYLDTIPFNFKQQIALDSRMYGALEEHLQGLEANPKTRAVSTVAELFFRNFASREQLDRFRFVYMKELVGVTQNRINEAAKKISESELAEDEKRNQIKEATNQIGNRSYLIFMELVNESPFVKENRSKKENDVIGFGGNYLFTQSDFITDEDMRKELNGLLYQLAPGSNGAILGVDKSDDPKVKLIGLSDKGLAELRAKQVSEQSQKVEIINADGELKECYLAAVVPDYLYSINEAVGSEEVIRHNRIHRFGHYVFDTPNLNKAQVDAFIKECEKVWIDNVRNNKELENFALHYIQSIAIKTNQYHTYDKKAQAQADRLIAYFAPNLYWNLILAKIKSAVIEGAAAAKEVIEDILAIVRNTLVALSIEALAAVVAALGVLGIAIGVVVVAGVAIGYVVTQIMEKLLEFLADLINKWLSDDPKDLSNPLLDYLCNSFVDDNYTQVNNNEPAKSEIRARVSAETIGRQNKDHGNPQKQKELAVLLKTSTLTIKADGQEDNIQTAKVRFNDRGHEFVNRAHWFAELDKYGYYTSCLALFKITELCQLVAEQQNYNADGAIIDLLAMVKLVKEKGFHHQKEAEDLILVSDFFEKLKYNDNVQILFDAYLSPEVADQYRLKKLNELLDNNDPLEAEKYINKLAGNDAFYADYMKSNTGKAQMKALFVEELAYQIPYNQEQWSPTLSVLIQSLINPDSHHDGHLSRQDARRRMWEVATKEGYEYNNWDKAEYKYDQQYENDGQKRGIVRFARDDTAAFRCLSHNSEMEQEKTAKEAVSRQLAATDVEREEMAALFEAIFQHLNDDVLTAFNRWAEGIEKITDHQQQTDRCNGFLDELIKKRGLDNLSDLIISKELGLTLAKVAVKDAREDFLHSMVTLFAAFAHDQEDKQDWAQFRKVAFLIRALTQQKDRVLLEKQCERFTLMEENDPGKFVDALKAGFVKLRDGGATLANPGLKGVEKGPSNAEICLTAQLKGLQAKVDQDLNTQYGNIIDPPEVNLQEADKIKLVLLTNHTAKLNELLTSYEGNESDPHKAISDFNKVIRSMIEESNFHNNNRAVLKNNCRAGGLLQQKLEGLTRISAALSGGKYFTKIGSEMQFNCDELLPLLSARSLNEVPSLVQDYRTAMQKLLSDKEILKTNSKDAKQTIASDAKNALFFFLQMMFKLEQVDNSEAFISCLDKNWGSVLDTAKISGLSSHLQSVLKNLLEKSKAINDLINAGKFTQVAPIVKQAVAAVSLINGYPDAVKKSLVTLVDDERSALRDRTNPNAKAVKETPVATVSTLLSSAVNPTNPGDGVEDYYYFCRTDLDKGHDIPASYQLAVSIKSSLDAKSEIEAALGAFLSKLEDAKSLLTADKTHSLLPGLVLPKAYVEQLGMHLSVVNRQRLSQKLGQFLANAGSSQRELDGAAERAIKHLQNYLANPNEESLNSYVAECEQHIQTRFLYSRFISLLDEPASWSKEIIARCLDQIAVNGDSVLKSLVTMQIELRSQDKNAPYHYAYSALLDATTHHMSMGRDNLQAGNPLIDVVCHVRNIANAEQAIFSNLAVTSPEELLKENGVVKTYFHLLGVVYNSPVHGKQVASYELRGHLAAIDLSEEQERAVRSQYLNGIQERFYESVLTQNQVELSSLKERKAHYQEEQRKAKASFQGLDNLKAEVFANIDRAKTLQGLQDIFVEFYQNFVSSLGDLTPEQLEVITLKFNAAMDFFKRTTVKLSDHQQTLKMNIGALYSVANKYSSEILSGIETRGTSTELSRKLSAIIGHIEETDNALRASSNKVCLVNSSQMSKVEIKESAFYIYQGKDGIKCCYYANGNPYDVPVVDRDECRLQSLGEFTIVLNSGVYKLLAARIQQLDKQVYGEGIQQANGNLLDGILDELPPECFNHWSSNDETVKVKELAEQTVSSLNKMITPGSTPLSRTPSMSKPITPSTSANNNSLGSKPVPTYKPSFTGNPSNRKESPISPVIVEKGFSIGNPSSHNANAGFVPRANPGVGQMGQFSVKPSGGNSVANTNLQQQNARKEEARAKAKAMQEEQRKMAAEAEAENKKSEGKISTSYEDYFNDEEPALRVEIPSTAPASSTLAQKLLNHSPTGSPPKVAAGLCNAGAFQHSELKPGANKQPQPVDEEELLNEEDLYNDSSDIKPDM